MGLFHAVKGIAQTPCGKTTGSNKRGVCKRAVGLDLVVYKMVVLWQLLYKTSQISGEATGMKGWIWMTDGWLSKDFWPCNLNMKRSFDFYLFYLNLLNSSPSNTFVCYKEIVCYNTFLSLLKRMWSLCFQKGEEMTYHMGKEFAVRQQADLLSGLFVFWWCFFSKLQLMCVSGENAS